MKTNSILSFKALTAIILSAQPNSGGGYSSSLNLVTEIDGFAIFYDSAMRTLYWGGKASKPTKSRTEIHDLASWGRLIK